MKKYILFAFVFLLTSCIMSNRERERFPAAEYFNKQELPIAEAIYNGEEKKLQNLINQGANISHIGEEGFTYLMYAVMIENYEITELLLENGADPNQISPLMKTKRNARREEGERKRSLDMLPLETSCGSSYPIKYMKLLIKHGAVINVNNNKTPPPLEEAIITDDMEKIKYLVANGADINLLYQSSTPIMTAAKIMSWHMIDYLLDCGADVFHVNRNGYTIGLYMQEYIDRDVWTPYGRKRIEGIIERLKAKGVKFPVTKQEPTPTDSITRISAPQTPQQPSPTINIR